MDTTVEPSIRAMPFGTDFADRMSISFYANGAWSPTRIQPLAPLELHPGAHVLHYSSSCFEGLKAFRWADGTARLFRLERHVERMRQSARLLCLPVPSAELLTSMILELVAECTDAIPSPPGAMYLRPTLIGTETNIGAAGTGSAQACLYVLASPVGDYFAGGSRPLRILVEDHQARATPNFGMAKTGANYASGLRHVVDARARWNADQVLFCPGGDVQETGASNFMLIDDTEILTKRLDSSYLHGVTRDSILVLARELGYRVVERDFSVEELLERASVAEAALSGTAAVLAGVGTLVHRGQEYRVLDGEVGANTRKLRGTLTDIQFGHASDPRGWLRPS